MDTIKKLKWILSNAKSILPFLILITIIKSTLSLVGVYSALVSKSLIDAAISQEINIVIHWLTIMIAITFSQILIKPITSFLSTYSSSKLRQTIQERMYIHINKSEWSAVSKHHSISLLTRITSDTSTITSTIVSTIPGIISLGVTLTASFFTLFKLSPYITLVAFLIGPFLFIISRFFNKKLKVIYKEMEEEKVKYKTFIQESINNLLIVKTFCLENENIETVKKIQKNRMKLSLKRTFIKSASRVLMKISSFATYLAIFSWGTLNIAKGLSSYGTLTAMLQLYNNVKAPFASFAGTVPEFISTIAAAERLMEIEEMTLEPTNLKISNKNIVDNNIYSLNPPKIEFKNINFSYKENRTILKDINLTINPGEIIGLVGESGGGKTTLIRLLLNLIHSQHGDITLQYNDETPIKITKEHRDSISYVPQGNTLFSGTIKNNLLLANKNATDSELDNAIRQACAYDFIQELDDKLDTVLGENGMGISDGQAQRLSIARAFLRKRPILILDEATSSLDMETEYKVIKSISSLEHKPTCIIITHRPSALEICNKVYRLENGNLNLIENNRLFNEIASDIKI